MNTFASIGGLVFILSILYGTLYVKENAAALIPFEPVDQLTEVPEPALPFARDEWSYTFDTSGTLHESANPNESSSPYWWLDSGGMLVIEEDGIGRTIERSLPGDEPWLRRYQRSNPLDTDNGRHPQNLFRLVTKHSVADAQVSLVFRIRSINMTDSPNRGAWSGVFLMGRYIDGDNLYYAGIRQDGHAVIKKKIGGVYHTLAEEPLFESYRAYDPRTNPSLLPGNVWMGIAMNTVTEEDHVRISLSIDYDNTGSWKEVLSVIDTGVGGLPHSNEGRTGIRTDFMDVEFDSFTINTMSASGASGTQAFLRE